jgi:NADH-quinone oxidoreductase subunit N
VYEGASMPVAAVLSVVSKAAAAFTLLVLVHRVFAGLADAVSSMITILAVLTMTLGNVFALRQQVWKRLLAFSSIAQVGFILIAVVGMQPAGEAAVVYFLLVYLFANLLAFAVGGLLEQSANEPITLDHFKGLYQRHPVLAWTLALALFSLAGIPPTAGFFGKLFLLQAAASNEAYVLVVCAGLNMILSLFYYLRVVRFMFMESTLEVERAPIVIGRTTQLGLAIGVFGVLLAGVWSGVYAFILQLFYF